jgi:uncharacterized protein YyaL (SSP411 family)
MLKGFIGVMLLVVLPAAGQTSYNHLQGQSSPYLKRAASQPVDWNPWSPDVFQLAKKLDRPLLLDVGAIWCPWCGLMDRETYTDPAVAEFINQHFVAVKIDYDAAPELVAQLQRAQAVVNLPAGLPLTSFLTPDGTLYYGAGYLPSRRTPDKLSFREAADEALRLYSDKVRIKHEGYQLEVAK